MIDGQGHTESSHSILYTRKLFLQLLVLAYAHVRLTTPTTSSPLFDSAAELTHWRQGWRVTYLHLIDVPEIVWRKTWHAFSNV